jgi:hypothetical protein
MTRDSTLHAAPAGSCSIYLTDIEPLEERFIRNISQSNISQT